MAQYPWGGTSRLCAQPHLSGLLSLVESLIAPYWDDNSCNLTRPTIDVQFGLWIRDQQNMFWNEKECFFNPQLSSRPVLQIQFPGQGKRLSRQTVLGETTTRSIGTPDIWSSGCSESYVVPRDLVQDHPSNTTILLPYLFSSTPLLLLCLHWGISIQLVAICPDDLTLGSTAMNWLLEHSTAPSPILHALTRQTGLLRRCWEWADTVSCRFAACMTYPWTSQRVLILKPVRRHCWPLRLHIVDRLSTLWWNSASCISLFVNHIS